MKSAMLICAENWKRECKKGRMQLTLPQERCPDGGLQNLHERLSTVAVQLEHYSLLNAAAT